MRLSFIYPVVVLAGAFFHCGVPSATNVVENIRSYRDLYVFNRFILIACASGRRGNV